jgi:molybdopterin molybdotransferase
MKLFKVDTIEQARKKILDHVKSWQLKTEIVSLDEALDRVLTEDVFASCDIPSFRRSTVDGYAVITSDTAGADEGIPVFLKLTGSVLMGTEVNFSISCGECVYVPTGGMVPNGADAVVMIEYCEVTNDLIAIYKAAASGSGTAEVGEDFKNGKLLLSKGTCIRPQEIGALSAAGIININVFKPLTMILISTGDELVVPENNPPPGKIRDINTNMIKALAKNIGYKIIYSHVLPDDENILETTVKESLKKCDIVIISGGSSQGEKDFTAQIINRIAKPGIFTHGLAVKPGKPTILGWDNESKTLLVGLPGHPVSAMMIFKIIFGWLNKVINGIDNLTNDFPVISAKVSCNIPSAPGKTVCQPVVLTLKDDFYSAEPVFGKAGMISTLTKANGYIIIDMNKEGIKQGELVWVHPL